MAKRGREYRGPESKEDNTKPMAEKSEKITVRAKPVNAHAAANDNQVVGYYDNQRRRNGDIFEIDAKDFSERWMDKVAPGTKKEEKAEVGRAEVPLSRVNPVTGEEKV